MAQIVSKRLVFCLLAAIILSSSCVESQVIVSGAITIPASDVASPTLALNVRFMNLTAQLLTTFTTFPTKVINMVWVRGSAVVFYDIYAPTATSAGVLTTRMRIEAPIAEEVNLGLENGFTTIYRTSYGVAISWGQCSFPAALPVAKPTPGPVGAYDCSQNLSMTVLSSSIITNNARTAICNAAGIDDCSNVVVRSNPPSSGYVSTTFLISTLAGTHFLGKFLSALRTDGTVRSLGIVQVSVNGASIYTTASLAGLPKVVTCQERMKWLIFLLLLIPILAVLGRFTYRKGVARGKEVARRDEKNSNEQIHRLAKIAGAPAPPPTGYTRSISIATNLNMVDANGQPTQAQAQPNAMAYNRNISQYSQAAPQGQFYLGPDGQYYLAQPSTAAQAQNSPQVPLTASRPSAGGGQYLQQPAGQSYRRTPSTASSANIR